MRVTNLCWALLLLALLPLSLSQRGRSGVPSRNGHEDEVTVRTEAELHEAFSHLRHGQIVVVEAKEMTLTETLVAGAGNVTLKGMHERLVTIQCSPRTQQSALIIRRGPMRISSLNFTGCTEQSAVVIEAPRDVRRRISVTFENVHFSHNGAALQQIFGAAVRTSGCTTHNCAQPILRFRLCQFVENRGLLGGAIFAENADVVLDRCTFHKNAADLTGGAVYLRHTERTTLKIVESTFEENSAHADEKVHGNTNAELSSAMNETLVEAGYGGAVFASNAASISVRRSYFVRNVGCRGGGAIGVVTYDVDAAKSAQAYKIRDSRFQRNVAFCGSQQDVLEFVPLLRESRGGGALLHEALSATNLVWMLKNSTFEQNQAVLGGALHFRSLLLTTAVHEISSCFFDLNVALRSGGSIVQESAHVVVRNTTFKSGRAMYGGAIDASEGAMLFFESVKGDPSLLSYIENSTALYGGGILSENGGLMDIAALVLRDNVAMRSGGAMTIGNNVATVEFRGVLIENNCAYVAGGVEVQAVDAFYVLPDGDRPTIFRNNTAVAGGGLHYRAGLYSLCFFQLVGASFIGNRALPTTSLMMTKLTAASQDYRPLPSADVRAPNYSEHLGDFTLLDYITDTNEGFGGGIYISFVDVQLFTAVEALFFHLRIEENEAVVGGGIAAVMKDLYWNQGNRRGCFPLAVGQDACQMFVLVNATVVRNKAEYAAGVFSSLPEGIAVSCMDDSSPRVTAANFTGEVAEDPSLLLPYCSNISANEIVDTAEQLGANAATNAVSLAVEGWDGPLKQVASGERLSIPCEGGQNTSCSRDLHIAVKDIFGHTVMGGIDDANLELVLVSDAVVGDLRYRAMNGIAVINNTYAWGINVSANLTVVSERDPSIRLEIQMSTRECYPGEINQVDVCRDCPFDQYGFEPLLEKCESCEKNAKCRGGASLVPEKGYWHSTPFSPIFRQCLYPDACDYEGRASKLEAFYEDAATLRIYVDALGEEEEHQTSTADIAEYPQCTEGYEGPLCGSCQEGYGHDYSRTCKNCPDQSSTKGFSLFLSCGCLFLLIGANCIVTLMSMNSRVELVRHELQGAPRIRSRRRRSVRFTTSSQANISRNSPQRVEISSESEETASNAQQIFAKQLIATVQLTETLKILINYLQVTSIAVRLQIDWNAWLEGLLRLQGGLSGLPNVIMSVPYECHFSGGDVPASVSALWMHLATPWIVLAALLLLLMAGTVAIKLRRVWKGEDRPPGPSSRQRFLTYVIIICIVALYFSYIDMARELLRAINCVEIESSVAELSPDHPYLRYATEKMDRHVWAEDTDLLCFEGSHLAIGTTGVVGLFCLLCGIIWIIIWLPLNRRHKCKTEFVARYWFLYQAYRTEWYTNGWESTILIRKALIAAVVVFSVHLAPSLQAALCVGVLVVCHMLHSLVLPFKVPREHQPTPEYSGSIFRILRLPRVAAAWVKLSNSIDLNTLESVSLFASTAMFFSAIVLQDTSVTSLGRTFMILFAFAINAGFLLYMLYRLYGGLTIVVDLKLELHGIPVSETQRNTTNVFYLSKKMYSLSCYYGKRWTNRDKQESSDASDPPPPPPEPQS